jgi:ankyrin repeat protein
LNSVYSLWQDVSGAALIVSTYLGEKKLVQLLLNEVEDERRHINRSPDLLGPALFAAVIKDNNEDVLQSLLSVPNIDPNITFYDSRTPLEVAVFNGHEKAACVLLNHPTINPCLGRHDPPILL